MARRIYFESVKKWGLRVGATGGTVVGLIFLYLLMTGGIEVLGYSGDMYCAGTEVDPCYAYINFTAKENIYIYPIDYDPWGRETPFTFEPNVKSWKLQRSWGKSWRTIDLTKTWSVKTKYAIKFAKGQTYNIRIVALKSNPKESIKWGAFKVIDPIWFGRVFENNQTCTMKIAKEYYACNIKHPNGTIQTNCFNEVLKKDSCVETGQVQYDDKLFKYEGMFCSIKDSDTIQCDSEEDGNGDGICQSGETCIERDITGKTHTVIDNSAKLKIKDETKTIT